jgi:hypothetical protein
LKKIESGNLTGERAGAPWAKRLLRRRRAVGLKLGRRARRESPGECRRDSTRFHPSTVAQLVNGKIGGKNGDFSGSGREKFQKK